MRKALLVGFLLLSTALAARAQAPTTQAQVEQANREFAGIQFGVGLGVTVDTGRRDRVDDATIDNSGFVRVNKKSNVRARVFLETHILPWCKQTSNGIDVRGCGPFVALQPGSEEIIQGIGLGFMMAWRRAENPKQSFNLGLGFVVDPNTRVLGDEFRENEQAPLDATGKPLPLRFQSKDKGGLLFFTSFTW